MTKKKATNGLSPDPHVWIQDLGIKTTADVEVPTRLIDQVIGQESAVEVARKAADQKRHLLLIGDPGTGKSMLAKAMTEILSSEKQHDILTYHNNKNPNNPKIFKAPGGDGKGLVHKYEQKANRQIRIRTILDYGLTLGAIGAGLWLWISFFDFSQTGFLSFLFIVLIALLYLYFAGQKRPKAEMLVPKLLIEHAKEAETAPYVDGTGSHAGALLGDVRHDPYQSGGLETAPHQRVEIGAIHRAHGGVLFIDEINVLRLESQQALLTALQEKKYSIVGQSQSSAGAMVKTEPVPCDFILVAAGNLDAVQAAQHGSNVGMHPALRSRIRGYGYEVFVNSVMDDTADNRRKLVQFVAQEVVRDGKIPHFEPAAVAEVIREAQRRAGRTGKLTLRLRELGGLVRTSGDIARSHGHDAVSLADVREAKASSRSLEQQITDKEIELALSDQNVENEGSTVGVANGLAIIGTGEVGEPAGLVVPVEAAVVPALSRSGGTIVLGEGLKGVHGSGVENVGALLKVLKGAAIADHDIHVDAHIRHPEAEADGIGIAAAVAAISALESLPVKQEYCLVGTVAVNGDLRPVRALLQRIEAAARLGYAHVVVPASAQKTLLVDDYIREQIDIVYCDTLAEVLRTVLDAPEGLKLALTSRIDRAHTNGHGKKVPAKAHKVAPGTN
jgi:ATP-dependent Lon protease